MEDTIYTIYTRDTVPIQTDKGVLYALSPVYRRDTTEFWPAVADGHSLSKGQAELLARTVAPHLFPQEGTEPWRTPIRETYADLAETVQSYGRDLRASGEADWDAGALTQSLSGLLDALNGTLDRLEKLL